MQGIAHRSVDTVHHNQHDQHVSWERSSQNVFFKVYFATSVAAAYKSSTLIIIMSYFIYIYVCDVSEK